MKKSVLGLLMVIMSLFLIFQLKAQTPSQPFYSRSNLVAYTGLVTGDKGHLGHYYGLYGDITLNSDPYFMNGVFAQASRSGGKKNDYSSQNYELGGGYFLGLYRPDLFQTHQFFLSSTIGVLYQKDRQNDGWYKSVQDDVFLKLDLNFNFMKKNEFSQMFPRTQLEIRYKNSLKSSKTASWKEEVALSDTWNKDYVETIFKQSILKKRLKDDIYFSPKIVGFHSYSWGDKTSYYGVGIETALFKRFRDDFISLQILYKGNSKFSRDYLVVGLNLNFSNLFKK